MVSVPKTHTRPDAGNLGYEVTLVDNAGADCLPRRKTWVKGTLLALLGVLMLLAIVALLPRLLEVAVQTLDGCGRFMERLVNPGSHH